MSSNPLSLTTRMNTGLGWQMSFGSPKDKHYDSSTGPRFCSQRNTPVGQFTKTITTTDPSQSPRTTVATCESIMEMKDAVEAKTPPLVEGERDETMEGTEGTKTAASVDVENEEKEEIKEGEAEETTEPTEEELQREAEAAEEKRKEEAALREKYKDWPLKDIEEPHPHDVLYGRGGGTNHHPGNKRYRQMVEDRKLDYVNSKRLDKPLVALEIIREWRSQLPPGRFLKIDEKTKKWNDVGDKKAREKTSQALREKAPLIRKQQEEEKLALEIAERGEDDDETKGTRFAQGTNPNDGAKEGGLTKSVLARDHSLGREYLEKGAEIDVTGFSWQEPFQNRNGEDVGRVTSQGSYIPPDGFYPGSRTNSYGMPPPPPQPGTPYHYSSGGSPPLPAGERQFRYSTSGRYESWGSMPPPGSPGYAFPPPQAGSWSRDPSMGREHSLGQNPLPHASIGHAGPYPAFDQRMGSGQWGPPQPYPGMGGAPAYNYSGGPPPPGSFAPGEFSGTSPPMPPPQHHRAPSGNVNSPPSPRFEVSPSVASTWSGTPQEEIKKTWSGSSADDMNPQCNSASATPKPEVVKRATSNQNETQETKPDLQGPSVKRAALRRNGTEITNRLQEETIRHNAGLERPNPIDHEIRIISRGMRQSSLNEVNAGTGKPRTLASEGRVSTLDSIDLDLMRPGTISASDRADTVDSFSVLEPLNDVMPSIDRPEALSFDERLTTADLMNIVQEPLVDDDSALVSGGRQPI